MTRLRTNGLAWLPLLAAGCSAFTASRRRGSVAAVMHGGQQLNENGIGLAAVFVRNSHQGFDAFFLLGVREIADVGPEPRWEITIVCAWTASGGTDASIDPIGFSGGLTNLYEYVGGDPINGADPSGLFQYCDRPGEENFQYTDPAGNLLVDTCATPAYNAEVARSLDILFHTNQGGKMQSEIRKKTPVGLFEQLNVPRGAQSTNATATKTGRTTLDPRQRAANAVNSRGEDLGLAILIGHEFGHSVLGLEDEEPRIGRFTNVEDNEAPLRHELGVPGISGDIYWR